MDCKSPSSFESELLDLVLRLQGWIEREIARCRPVEMTLSECVELVLIRLRRENLADRTTEFIDELIRHHVRSVLSKHRRTLLRQYSRTVQLSAADEHPAPDSFIDHFEASEEARRILESLPKDVRKLVEHVYSLHEEEFSRSDLAHRLQISRNTLDQRLSRAMRRLRISLGIRRSNG